jgi:hypothetical protein
VKKPGDMTVADLQDESVRCESAMGEAETILADLRVRLGEIRAEIAKRMRPSVEPSVSDHALLRYAERILGIDMEEMRSQILTEATKSALRMGASGVTVNGVKMVAKDGRIVTVLAEGMRPKKKTKRGWIDVEDELDEAAA